MTTIEEKLTTMLVENGMFEEQAQAIMEIVKADDASISMEGRWCHNVDSYPMQLLDVIWLSVKLTALQWIDENMPQAWNRAMFTDQA